MDGAAASATVSALGDLERGEGAMATHLAGEVDFAVFLTEGASVAQERATPAARMVPVLEILGSRERLPASGI